MASKSDRASPPGSAPGWAPSLAAVFLAALLWGVGYVEPPPVLGTGLLILAGLVVAGFCIWTRRRTAVAVALACILAIAAFVVDVLVLERNVLLVTYRTDFGQPPPTSLRVLNFNILHGYPHFPEQEQRAEQTIAALAALDLDVIVLQEAWRTRHHGDFVAQLGEALGMDSAFARANGNLERIGFEEGEAILSRYPILQAMRMQLEPRKPFFERRVALLCILDLGDGETLTVVGTHLDNRDLDVANAQAAHLAGRIEPLGRPIIAGDLNAPSQSPALGAFEALGYRDLLPGGIDHVLFPSDSSWQVQRVDWALASEHVEELIGVRTQLSDHPAVLVELAHTD